VGGSYTPFFVRSTHFEYDLIFLSVGTEDVIPFFFSRIHASFHSACIMIWSGRMQDADSPIFLLTANWV
jgi:hypothetical protein